MLKTKEEIEEWLQQYKIENYTINKDLTINVESSVFLNEKRLEKIPVNFNKINGNFNCSENKLTSLEFCPEIINGNFNCSENNLTSLEFCPEEITGNFNCSYNNLTSLEFCPEEIGGLFHCSHNQLTSLKYCPKEIKGNFNCSNNQLTSLEYLPKNIMGYFFCTKNQIKKEKLYLFDSNINGDIFSDFGNKEKFFLLVLEQKILKEKEELNNNLYSNENILLAKKRL